MFPPRACIFCPLPFTGFVSPSAAKQWSTLHRATRTLIFSQPHRAIFRIFFERYFDIFLSDISIFSRGVGIVLDRNGTKAKQSSANKKITNPRILEFLFEYSTASNAMLFRVVSLPPSRAARCGCTCGCGRRTPRRSRGGRLNPP